MAGTKASVQYHGLQTEDIRWEVRCSIGGSTFRYLNTTSTLYIIIDDSYTTSLEPNSRRSL